MKQEILIQPKELPYIWPEAAEVITKGLSHSNGEVDADSFFLPIYTGRQYLWAGYDTDAEVADIEAVLIGEIIKYPLKTSLFIHVWATKSGHDYEPWMKLWDSIINFANLNGCDFVEAKVRKGLAKKLKWTDKHSLVTLEL
mgnify:FL=1|tara:strand:- start:243 stop:665 length:423 start_codon:yes stop_codon:yes gene_type:complete